MSKKRKNRSKFRRTRDTTVIANQRLRSTNSQIDLEDFLRSIEDRREFHPDGPSRSARSFNSDRHRLVVPAREPVHRDNFDHMSSTLYAAPPAAVGFENSDKVIVCVRRGIRKEVLHALGKTGKGGQKRPRRSEYSDIQC